MALTKHTLSGSTNGRGIKIAATSTPGTLIHETGTATGTIDEIWLWAYNDDTVSVTLTLEWGGTTDPDDTSTHSIPPGGTGLLLLSPGLALTGTGAAVSRVAAFANTANKLVVTGYVNRIS